MSLNLLHQEYSEKAKEAGAIPYSYRSYCRLYQEYAFKYKVTMLLKRKPGELLVVDWAGLTLFLKNKEDGADIKVYLFIACLPYS